MLPANKPVIPLTIEHLHSFAAWLAHGPGTARQVAGKADIPLIELRPRTEELVRVGAVQVFGQSSDGPIYRVAVAEVNAPSSADVVERRINTLPVRDQVSIAAGIMAKHGRRGRHSAGSRRNQPEFF